MAWTKSRWRWKKGRRWCRFVKILIFALTQKALRKFSNFSRVWRKNYKKVSAKKIKNWTQIKKHFWVRLENRNVMGLAVWLFKCDNLKREGNTRKNILKKELWKAHDWEFSVKSFFFPSLSSQRLHLNWLKTKCSFCTLRESCSAVKAEKLAETMDASTET